MSTVKSTTLYYREGSSDKVYKASIEEKDSGYIVNFAYGRRGNTLTTGTKTTSPVTLDKASGIFSKLISEKTSKGYTEDTTGKAYSSIQHMESRATNILPQLLNEISEGDVEKCINDPAWCAQEKYDGVRRLIIKTETGVVGTNRKGLTIALSKELETQLQALLPDKHYILDGEAIGDTVVVFDYLTSDIPYKDRYKILENQFQFEGTNLKLAPTAWTTQEKRDLYARLRTANAEGIVFKLIDAPYAPGRPNSGGTQLKFKFVETATCLVTGCSSSKSSVSLAVFDGDKQVDVGNATVYANMQQPKPGDIVEVRYLYYFPGGSLFQPVLLGVREDMFKEDCKLSQLKTKREEELI